MKREPVTLEAIAAQTCVWADAVKAHQKAEAIVEMFQQWFNTGIPTGVARVSVASFDKSFAAAEAEERKAWRAMTRAARRLIELSERFQAANQPLGV